MFCFIRYFQSNDFPVWIRNVCVNMDNCTGQNKNRFVIAFLSELVRIGRFDTIYLKFMMPGHTKV